MAECWKSVQSADKEVEAERANHKLWQERLLSDKEAESIPKEQLPVVDLDTQQEALVLMLRKKIERMEEEENERIKEGKREKTISRL